MLTRLGIKDFQSHEKLDLRLTERVTTIVGPTDSGKSAIIRAIKWLCLNKPRGTAFIRDGAKETSVKVKADRITTERSSGKENRYRVGRTEFKAFGVQVPETVQSHLNVGEINFQSQHDAPFWFSLTAGEVARELNAIVDLDAIDVALARIASNVKDAKSKVEGVRYRIEQDEEDLEELAFVPRLAEAYEDLEGQRFSLEEKGNRRASLAVLVRRGTDSQERAENATRAAVAAQKGVVVGETLRDIRRRTRRLQDLVEDAEELQISASRDIPDLFGLERREKAYKIKANMRENLYEVLCQAIKQTELYNRTKRALAKAEIEMEEEFGSRCPVCGNFYKEKNDASAVEEEE